MIALAPGFLSDAENSSKSECELVLARIINCLLAGAQRLKLMILTSARDIWSDLQQDER